MSDCQEPKSTTPDDHGDTSSELTAFAAAVVESGLLASTSGNVSLRTADGSRMILSASGASLADLTHDEVVTVSLDTGRPTGKGPRPSMESSLHRRVYQVRSRAHAIVHCQSRAATFLACHPDPPRNLNFIPEIPAYVRAHAYVAFGMPGSRELADSVARAFEDSEVTVVQMRNHGQVIIGATWQKAVQRGVFFELACELASRGVDLTTIPPDRVAQLREYARDG